MVGIMAAVMGLVLPSASARVPGHGVAPRGFVTSTRPFIVGVAAGVQIQPLLSAGDIIGGKRFGYQMTGVPDGLGAYRSSASTIELFMNHELARRDGDVANSRVSHLTLDNNGEVNAATYPIDGSEGYEAFCSSTLFTLHTGTPWYFTGEESPTSAHNGVAVGMNAISGQHREMPWLGHMFHENVVPVDGLRRAVTFVSEDGDAGKSQAYAFFSQTFGDLIRGDGSLRAWVPNGHTDGHPSTDDIQLGDVMKGHFVTIPHAGSLSPAALNAASDDVGAFAFVRIEDATADPNDPGVVYFSDTGSYGRETLHGRIYRLTVDPTKPRKASLEVVLDGDAGDAMVNPDNLGISDEALVIQEDRNNTESGWARVLVYDLSSGSLTAAARVDPFKWLIDLAGRGVWETSGVIDASAFFGSGWWLLDVESHGTHVRQPGPGLRPDSARGEGGQLLKVFIPNT